MLRGGSWNNHPRNCRSAYRNRNRADDRNRNNGLRVCLVPSTISDLSGNTISRALTVSTRSRALDAEGRNLMWQQGPNTDNRNGPCCLYFTARPPPNCSRQKRSTTIALLREQLGEKDGVRGNVATSVVKHFFASFNR